MKLLAFLGATLLSAAALSQTGAPAPTTAPAPTGSPGGVTPYRFTGFGPPLPQRPAAAPAANVGTVLSVQTAGGYTYIEVAGPAGNTWLAAPISNVAVGERIRYGNGALMQNFSSRALGRTFPMISFVGAVSPAGDTPPPVAAAPAAAQDPHQMPQQMPHGMPQQQPHQAPAHLELSEGKVLFAQDAGGYSYIEIRNTGGNNTWLAAPSSSVKAGDIVRYAGGAVMKNFSSRGLNRTFPEIVFVDRVSVVTGN